MNASFKEHAHRGRGRENPKCLLHLATSARRQQAGGRVIKRNVNLALGIKKLLQSQGMIETTG